MLTIAEKVRQYDVLRAQVKDLQDKMKNLSSEIKSYCKEHGVQNDKGSHYCENSRFIYGNVVSKSGTLDVEKTLAYLKENGLTQAIKTVEVIDEDEIERMYSNGTIPPEDFDSLIQYSYSEKVYVGKKEQMSEVEILSIPRAASTKKKIQLKRKR